MRASALQKALPVVAGMIADRTGVEIKTGMVAATEGKVIYLPPLPLELKDEDFVRAIGYTYHECGHIKDTDFSVMGRFSSALQKAVWNILEDIRIEKIRMAASPGARSYLTRLVAILTQSGMNGGDGFDPVPNDESVHVSAVFQAYLLYKLRHDVLDQVAIKPLLETAEAAMERFPQGMRTRLEALMYQVESCANSHDVLELADAIIQMIEEEKDKEDEPKQQPQDPQDSPSGDEAEEPSDGPSGSSDGDQGDSSDGDQGGDGDQQGQSDGNDSGASQDGSAGDSSDQGNGAGGDLLKQLLAMTDDQVMESVDEKLQRSLNQASSAAVAAGRVVTSANVHPLKLPNQQADTSRIKSAINSIRTRTRAWLSSLAESDSQLVHSGKSLDYTRLFQGRFGGPMFVRTEEGVDINTDMILLEDISGSMDRIIGLASEAMLATVLAYDIPGVNTQVAAFPVCGRVSGGYDADGVGVVKRWTESARLMGGRIQALKADGTTPMAQAILWAVCELLKRDPAARIIMVATDGEPDNAEATIEVIQMARSAGVQVLGLGIGCDPSKVFGKEYSAHIGDINDLTGVMVKLIKQAMKAR